MIFPHRFNRLEIGLKPLIPLDCGPRGTVMPSPHECLHPLVLRIQVMSILNLRCPLCAAVFVDFEACCAVTCAVR